VTARESAPILPPLYHVGIVVRDMAAASAAFEARWGVPTERIFDLDCADATFRGHPARVRARYGFLATGASEIELIEPLDDAPNPYNEFLAEHGEGVHHLAYIVESIAAYTDHLGGELSTAGRVVLDAALPMGGRFTYLEGLAFGPVVELIEVPRS
jgi:catechol 2,3-dioxygenase-like lactoylglutathione lyase family enzyme